MTENNNNLNLGELENIEEKLSVYVSDDKSDRISVYSLMEEVKSKELYLSRELGSFTSWVNFIAQNLGVGSSTLWRKYKAGRTFKEFQERTNYKLEEDKNISVSFDTIASIETLAGKDSKKLDSLISRAIKGRLGREDVRKALREKRKNQAINIPKSRHDRILPAERTEISSVMASDIILELGRWNWLSDMTSEPIRLNSPIKSYLYHLETELGIVTGTSAHKRRFDGLIFENLTIDSTDNYGVNVHGIEIKVNKYDLMGDTKMQEYTHFCDYFYIAIPKDNELINIARDIKLPEWGIVVFDDDATVDDKKLRIIDKPKKLTPVFKDKVFENLTLRLLGKTMSDFS